VLSLLCCPGRDVLSWACMNVAVHNASVLDCVHASSTLLTCYPEKH